MQIQKGGVDGLNFPLPSVSLKTEEIFFTLAIAELKESPMSTCRSSVSLSRWPMRPDLRDDIEIQYK